MARGRCPANHDSIVTVWDDRYCVEAASTNSTTKQRRVVELARTEGLLDVTHAPFESDDAWSRIAAVHDPTYVEAVRTGGPVAIVDLDAHPGDGTYRLARDEGRIALFDIAGGTWESVARSPTVEYHDVRHAAAYRQALDAFPAFLDRVGPALVQYQAGMDPFEDDPVGGIAGVDAGFLRFRDRWVIGHVLSRRIPLVINLAGGYITGVSERLHLETVRLAVNARRRQLAGQSLFTDDTAGE